MKMILRAVGKYFNTPIEMTDLYYPGARCFQVEQGERKCYPVLEKQPLIGNAWDILLFDKISDELCYVHTGYWNRGYYIHEILTFVWNKNSWNLGGVLAAETPGRYSSVTQLPEEESAIYQSISQGLISYCDSVYHLDAERALKLFVSGSRMLSQQKEAGFSDVDCSVFRERWSGLKHPKELGIAQYAHIYNIELLNRETAIAKVGVAKQNDHFNDYLYLSYAAGSWKVVQKFTQLLSKIPEDI